MKKIRLIHLYLGCFFAPMLLFFAISGIWQTLGIHYHSKLLAELSTIHAGRSLKMGITLTSVVLRWFIVVMAASFVFSTILGVMMALTQGGNRRKALICLVLGILFPLVVMAVTVLAR